MTNSIWFYVLEYREITEQEREWKSERGNVRVRESRSRDIDIQEIVQTSLNWMFLKIMKERKKDILVGKKQQLWNCWDSVYKGISDTNILGRKNKWKNLMQDLEAPMKTDRNELEN